MAKKSEITFYSFLDTLSRPSESQCIKFISERSSSLNYPCILLIRDNTWNDYAYFSGFTAYYLKGSDDISNLGYVKIITSDPQEFEYKEFGKYTVLPDNFKFLDKKKFCSRGIKSFYSNLDSTEHLDKDIILRSLNDVNYNNYQRDSLKDISSELLKAYDKSLYRADFISLDFNTNFAKDAAELLEKISISAMAIEKTKDISSDEKDHIIKLLYGSVIATLESYLGDAFKYNILNKKEFFDSFIKNYHPEGRKSFSSKKITIEELITNGSMLVDDYVQKEMLNTINLISFHKLEKVQKIFTEILNIDLPAEWIKFNGPIQNRHDIFHRNGKSSAGQVLKINSVHVKVLADDVLHFISIIEEKLSAKT